MSVTSEPTPEAMVPQQQVAAKGYGDVEVKEVLEKYEGMKIASEEEKSFIWPEGTRPGPEDVYDKYDFELPVIDLTPVLKLQGLQKELGRSEGEAKAKIQEEIQACEEAKKGVEKEVRTSCEQYGFFQIINHGFPMEVVEQLSESLYQLFDLPLEDKMKVKDVPKIGGPSLAGYTPMVRQTAFTRMNPSHIWNEGIEMETPEYTNPGWTEEMGRRLWPEDSTKGQLYSSSAIEYGKQSSRVTSILLDLIAASLGIATDAVDSLVGDRQKIPQMTGLIRANHYPPCPHPYKTWALHGHTDPDVITLLHQDAVGGLQIRFRDGSWHGVRPFAGAFVINCGDYLQAWTNGRFLSAEHRVLANDKSRRLSIAYFVFSDMNYVINPRPECVDAEHPLKYKPFTAVEFFTALLTRGMGRDKGELLDAAFGINN